MAKPTAIGYIRVSTSDQQLGLEAQRAAIARFAAEHGIDVLSIVSEVISGGAEFHLRTGLRSACEQVARTGASHLIIAKRDRLSRVPMVSLLAERGLEQLGATVMCCDGINAQDPVSEFTRGLLDAVAQFERALIGARTKAALASAKAKGVKVGRPKGRVDTKPRKTRSDKGRKRSDPPVGLELARLADWRHLAPRKVKPSPITRLPTDLTGS